LIPNVLLEQHRFPGEDLLIDCGATAIHCAIDRDELSRVDDDLVPVEEFFDAHPHLLPSPNDPGELGPTVEELFDGPTRALHGELTNDIA
jgi:hypothetical protein